MPFATLADLRASALFSRSKVIQSFNEDQLAKFASIYNAVHGRVLKNGGTEDEAESQAVAIALSAARRHTPVTAPRAAEASLHYFAPMMPEQLAGTREGGLAGQENDFSWVRENPDIASLIARGNAFNHDHAADEQLGIIHGVVLPEHVPAHITFDRENTPFLFVASYFADTPEHLKREAGISAEWEDWPAPDGRHVIIPHTFAVSATPLNPPVTGIRKVSSSSVEVRNPRGVLRVLPPALFPQVEETDSSLQVNGDGMTPNPNPGKPPAGEGDAADKIASIRTEFEQKLASMQAELAEANKFRVALASLVAAKPEAVDPAKAVGDLTARFASLEAENKRIAAEHAAFKVAALKADATRFAETLVSEGKIASADVGKWAGLYEKVGKDEAAGLASTLVASLPGNSSLNSRGAGEPEVKKASAEVEGFMAHAFPYLKPKKEGA